ncbi:MAG: hypothetical protein ACKVWR_20970 [Acidimicrobiales bacterium]
MKRADDVPWASVREFERFRRSLGKAAATAARPSRRRLRLRRVRTAV